jgi:hypothetical protein
MRSRALTQYIRYVPIHSYSPTLQTMNSVHGLFFCDVRNTVANPRQHSKLKTLQMST